MLEREYQAHVIKELHARLPGCVVLKNDSGYRQGVPDLTVLYRKRWAVLEVKAHAKARTRPNQQYYIDELKGMSFAAFIYPENEEEVLCDLQRTLRPGRETRVSKRE